MVKSTSISCNHGHSSHLQTFANLENGSVAVSRIHEIASLPAEENSVAKGTSPKMGQWPSAGEIKFEDVRLTYK